ncbi:MAG: hypothetical protein JOZ69_25840 [Myxococcales bacterium]|nr:hypothetical protein [Myxococcales bacterium]
MSKKRVTVSLRTPPPSDVPPPPESGLAPAARSAVEGPVVRTRVGDRREVTLYLPVDVARQLFLRCAERNCDASALVAEALAAALSDPERREVEMPADLWSRARVWLGELWLHLSPRWA